MIDVMVLKVADWKRAKGIFSSSFGKEIGLNSNFSDNILGLYLDEVLIGVVQVDFIRDIFLGDITMFINSFCVDEDYRNLGYGDFFLKRCILYGKEKGATKIKLTSNKSRVAAQRLYKRNGFEIVDTVLFKREI